VESTRSRYGRLPPRDVAHATRRIRRVALVGLLVVVTAACGSGAHHAEGGSGPTAKGGTQPQDISLGTGVTATQIKIGVMMIDFACIEQFVDAVEPDLHQAYQIFIDDINAKGGINGRKIVPVYK